MGKTMMKKYFVFILVAIALFAMATGKVYAEDVQMNIDVVYEYGISINIEASENMDFCAIVAMYDENDKFLGVKKTDITSNDFQNGILECSFSAPNTVDKVRVFVWDSLDRMVPIVGEEIVVNRANVSNRISFWGNDFMAGVGSQYLNMSDNLKCNEGAAVEQFSDFVIDILGDEINIGNYAGAEDDYFGFISESINECLGDVLILNLGGDKLDADSKVIVEQCQKMIESLEYKNKAYLVIGFLNGTEDSEKYNDSIFEQAFGANYVNLRRELASEECVKKFVTDITNEDCMMMDMGRIPDCLRIDEIHLNRMGYKAAAMIISEKMKELYYIE